MYQNGISILPGALPPDVSRGHPLLFYVCSASCMLIGGSSISAMHIFPLLASVLLLSGIYFTCLSFFGIKPAIASTVLVASQSMFFAQSSLLLPEIFLAALSIWTLYFFTKRNLWLTAATTTLALYTKESAICLAATICLLELIICFKNKSPLKIIIINLAILTLPLLAIALFFIAQHNRYGWWLFPEHVGYINFSPELYKGALRFSLELIFFDQWRIAFWSIANLLALVATVKNKKASILLLPLLFILCYMVIHEQYAFISRWLFYGAIIPGLYLLIHGMNKLSYTTQQQSIYLYSIVTFSIVYLVFTAGNFFTDRYLTIILVLSCIFLIALIQLLTNTTNSKWFTPIVLVLIAISITHLFFDTRPGDTRMGLADAVHSEEQLIRKVEELNIYTDSIAVPQHLIRQHLLLPLTGYRTTKNTFMHLASEIKPGTQYLIVNNMGLPEYYAQQITREACWKPIYTISIGESKGTIYTRTK